MGGLTGILSQVPIPLSDPIAWPRRQKEIESREGTLTTPWIDYFTSLGGQVQAGSSRVAQVAFPAGQTASIGATDITNGAIAAGLYAFWFYLRITVAGGAGYTVQVTLDWLDGGVARSFVGNVMPGTILANNNSDGVPLIRVDGGSPVRYSVAVVVGAPPVMQYALDVVLLRVQ